MKTEIENLPRGQAKITIELTPDEYQPFLKEAAFRLSEKIEVRGFRPGKAPYDIIKQHVGEAKIWEEALEPAVKKTLIKAINERNLITVGSPKIDVEKLAPNNPVIYKATLNLLPQVELADYNNLTVSKKEIRVEQSQVDKALEDLRKLRGKEILVSRAAKLKDKVEVDFTAYLDKVPLENGTQKKFPIILGENTFVLDFEKNLVGLKKDDEKEFQVKFPENFHQRNIAGKLIDFQVKVLAVYEIQLPELNDEFAKNIGKFSNLNDLTSQLKDNLIKEAEHQEEHRLEEEIIDKLVNESKFTDICDILVTTEVNKMIAELEANLKNQGMEFDDYLRHIKKERVDLLLDFSPTAIKRIKAALVTRQVAKKENIEVAKEEIESEVKILLSRHAHQPEMIKQAKSQEFRDYLRNVIVSRKVIKLLKDKMVK